MLPGSAAERAGTLRYAARMFVAQHHPTVPKLHVTLRKAFGFRSSIMAMNPFDGQTLSLALPAASGATVAKRDPQTRARLSTEQAGGALQLASRLAFHDVIDPRSALLQGLQLAASRTAGREPHRRTRTMP